MAAEVQAALSSGCLMKHCFSLVYHTALICFYFFLKHMNLLLSLDACQACTVFAPTNTALKNRNLVRLKIETQIIQKFVTSRILK